MMNCFSPLVYFCVFSGLVVILTNAEENGDVDKRYLAALAKNGRLPKFAQKKDQEVPQSSEKDDNEEDFAKDALVEEKRHIGAYLKAHGRPFYGRQDSFTSDSNAEGKRNIASMARMGKLNAMRYARFQPYSVGGKRMITEDASNNDEDNTIDTFEDPDCFELEEETLDDADERPIWVQKKRYVAALARSGRLPIWHSQRMWWGGKRDLSSNSELEDNQAENTLGFVAAKNKKCKKIYGKRNIQAMAKNGKLPFRSNA